MLTTAEWQQIVELIKSGMTIQQAEKKLGINRNVSTKRVPVGEVLISSKQFEAVRRNNG